MWGMPWTVNQTSCLWFDDFHNWEPIALIIITFTPKRISFPLQQQHDTYHVPLQQQCDIHCGNYDIHSDKYNLCPDNYTFTFVTVWRFKTFTFVTDWRFKTFTFVTDWRFKTFTFVTDWRFKTSFVTDWRFEKD